MHEIDGAASGGREQNPGERWSAHAGDLLGAAAPRNGFTERFHRDHVRKNGLTGRTLKSASGRGEKQTQVNHGDGAEGKDQQDGSGNQEQLRSDHDSAAVMPVRDVAGEQREEQERGHLDETNVAEHNRRTGGKIQIPAYGDGQHLQAKAGEECADEEQFVIRGAERSVSVHPLLSPMLILGSHDR